MNDFEHCPTEGALGLLTLLVRGGHTAEARLDDALARADLTFVKWRLLDLLVKAGDPAALKTLPDALGCVKSNVTQLADRMEADGLVQRIPSPGDRRSSLVALTDAGRDAHGSGRQALEGTTAMLFASFTGEERERLRDLLKQLNGV